MTDEDLKAWIRSEIRRVEGTAMEAKNRRYTCTSSDIITSLEDRVSRWDTWWKGIMVSLVVTAVGIGSFIWTTKAKTESVENKLVIVDTSVKILTKKFEDVANSQEKMAISLEKSTSTSEDVLNGVKDVVFRAIMEAERGPHGSPNSRTK